jgi:protein TonB
MTRVVSLFEFMPYGAPELQSVARQYMVRALLLASTICTVLFLLAGAFLASSGSLAIAPAPRTIHIDQIPPPPPIEPYAVIPRVPPAVPAFLKIGNPVPVPDEKVIVEGTIPSQQEMHAITPGVETGPAPLVVDEPAASPGDEKPWSKFVYTEELPAPVRTVAPEYSTIARAAGVGGRVVAHALVDRTGHVTDVRIDPEFSIPMLNEEVIRAVRQWVFTPAMANGKPVQVWVAVPFNFELH